MGETVICRARGCGNEAMPNEPFCGYHAELVEDGLRVLVKRGRPRVGKKRHDAQQQRDAEKARYRRHHGPLIDLNPRLQKEAIRKILRGAA